MVSYIYKKEDGQKCTLRWQNCGQFSAERGNHKHGLLRCLKNCDVHFVKRAWWKTVPSFNMTHIWHQRQLQRTAEKCSCTQHTVQTWSLQTTTYSQSWKITWEASTTSTTQSRKPCLTVCKVLEWISATARFLSLCGVGRNVWIILEILQKNDKPCPSNTDSICFLACTFVSMSIKCAHDFSYDLCNYFIQPYNTVNYN